MPTYLTGKDGYVLVYANRTQAQKAADKFGGVVHQSPRSMRFLVMLGDD